MEHKRAGKPLRIADGLHHRTIGGAGGHEACGGKHDLVRVRACNDSLRRSYTTEAHPDKGDRASLRLVRRNKRLGLPSRGCDLDRETCAFVEFLRDDEEILGVNAACSGDEYNGACLAHCRRLGLRNPCTCAKPQPDEDYPEQLHRHLQLSGYRPAAIVTV